MDGERSNPGTESACAVVILTILPSSMISALTNLLGDSLSRLNQPAQFSISHPIRCESGSREPMSLPPLQMKGLLMTDLNWKDLRPGMNVLVAFGKNTETATILTVKHETEKSLIQVRLTRLGGVKQCQEGREILTIPVHKPEQVEAREDTIEDSPAPHEESSDEG